MIEQKQMAGHAPAAETPRLQQILDEFNQVQIAQTRAAAIHGLSEALYRQEQIVEELQAKLAETPRPGRTSAHLAVVAKMIDEDQRPPIEMLKEMVRILRLKEGAPASETPREPTK